MRPGSRLLAKLNEGDPTPGAASYTSLFSANDELATPYTTSMLDGATNVLIQDVCPGRRVTHFGMVYDAVVNALVMDALNHDGPADPGRVNRAVCRAWIMPGADPTVALAFEALSDGGAVVLTMAARQVAGEPDLAGYTTVTSGAVATRRRIRLRVQPARAVAHRLVRFRFFASSGGRPLRDATVRFAGRRMRTDARGRVVVRARLRRGVWSAVATRRDHRAGRARVRVVARTR